MAGNGDPLDRECASSLAERLRRHDEVAAPIGQEEESRRGSLVLLSSPTFVNPVALALYACANMSQPVGSGHTWLAGPIQGWPSPQIPPSQ